MGIDNLTVNIFYDAFRDSTRTGDRQSHPPPLRDRDHHGHPARAHPSGKRWRCERFNYHSPRRSGPFARKIALALFEVLMIVLALIFIYPVIYVLINAFKSTQEIVLIRPACLIGRPSRISSRSSPPKARSVGFLESLVNTSSSPWRASPDNRFRLDVLL